MNLKIHKNCVWLFKSIRKEKKKVKENNSFRFGYLIKNIKEN